MAHALRYCGKVARSVTSMRPTTPTAIVSSTQNFTTTAAPLPGRSSLGLVQLRRASTATAKGKVDCACAGHPWPEEKKIEKPKQKAKDCDFDFRKFEVNPFDPPCDCQDPPPAAGCADLDRPKEVCCRSTRQYGCFCEEEEDEICEEESHDEMVITKTCDLDFRKLEVNPYDDPCECRDPPPASSCESLANRPDVCCRTPRPFGCNCDAYDDPGLECLKQKAPRQPRKKKECNEKNKFSPKCL